MVNAFVIADDNHWAVWILLLYKEGFPMRHSLWLQIAIIDRSNFPKLEKQEDTGAKVVNISSMILQA